MRFLAAVILFACLALSGCTNNDDRTNQNRFGGFYGGINGGIAIGTDGR